MKVLFYYDKLPLKLYGHASAPRQLAWVIKELKTARPNWHVMLASPGETDIPTIEHIPLINSSFKRKGEELKRKAFNTINIQYSIKSAVKQRSALQQLKPDYVVFVKYADIHEWHKTFSQSRIIFWPLSMFTHGQEFAFIRAIEKADLVIIHRPPFYEDLLRRISFHAFPAPVKFVSPISSGLNTISAKPSSEAVAAYRAKLGLDPNCTLLLCAGGRNFQKGRNVIELALAHPKFTGKNILLLSTGNAEEQTHLLKNGIKLKYLTMLGDEDYHKAVHAADIVLVPSMSDEPGPAVTPEYMAAGKAIIGSNIGGNQYFLNDENAWVIQNPNDVDEWSDKILNAYLNPEQAKAKAEKAFTDFKTWPPISAWGEEWAAAIEQMENIPKHGA